MAFDDPTWMQGTASVPSYSAREDRTILDQIWDEGVMDMASMKVSQRAAGANFTVDIAAGEAVIQGDDQTNQGKYLVRATTGENKAIAAAPGANSRYDLVVVQVNDPNATNVRTPANIAEFFVVTGTVAASPVVPALPATAIPLAVIGPIALGTASITDALIWDITDWASAAVAAQAMASISRAKAGHKAAPGSIEWSASKYAANGWLLCAGQSLSTTTYPKLFAEIGYDFGGAGANFNVPDLRGRVPVGIDNMGGADAGRLSSGNTIGAAGGAETHVLSAAEMGAHTHDIQHTHPIDPPSTALVIVDPNHNHTQNAHIHSQNAHNHTQNAHTHTQDGHNHNTSDFTNFVTQNLAAGSSGLQAVNAGVIGASNLPVTATVAAVNQSNTAVNQAATATNNWDTPTNNAAATGISGSVNIAGFTSGAASVVNSGSTGSSSGHNNMQPFLTLNAYIRT